MSTTTYLKTRDNVGRIISQLVRAAIEQSGSQCPIKVVDGFLPPRIEGRSYYWTTPGGTVVRHPQAFARRHWPTVYHGSTRRIEVGAGWICAALAAHWATQEERRREGVIRRREERELFRSLIRSAKADGVRFDSEGKFRETN